MREHGASDTADAGGRRGASWLERRLVRPLLPRRRELAAQRGAAHRCLRATSSSLPRKRRRCCRAGAKSSVVPKAIPVATRATATAAVPAAPATATVTVLSPPPPLPKAPLQQQSATSAMVEAVAKSSERIECSKREWLVGWYDGCSGGDVEPGGGVVGSVGVSSARAGGSRSSTGRHRTASLASIEANAVTDNANDTDASQAANDETVDRAASGTTVE